MTTFGKTVSGAIIKVVQDGLPPSFQGIPPPDKLSIITQFKIKDDVIQYFGSFFFIL